MRRLALALLAAASLTATAGCDFTPVLDVDTPDFVPGFALGAVLVADSTVIVGVGFAQNPYALPTPSPSYDDVRVTVTREGAPPERLVRRPCVPYEYGYDACSSSARYVGATVVQAGATYTVRVEGAGLPPAEATVAVPPRPAFTAVAGARSGPARPVTLTLDDPAGPHHYWLQTVRRSVITNPIYDDRGQPTGQVETSEYFSEAPFTTTEPTLVAAARYIPPDGVGSVLFDDRTFDGTPFTARLSVDDTPRGGEVAVAGALTVRLVAVSETLAEAFLEREFSLGGDDENPFVEPGNRPGNVQGGYGVVGGVAEATVAP